MDEEELAHRAHTVARVHSDLLAEALGERRVRAVWLTGSTMLRDLTPTSDIDTVTLTAGELGPGDAPALQHVHASLVERFPGLAYDTTYVDIASLARPPEPGLVVRQSLDGQLILDQPGGEIHPVTWFVLPDAIRVFGDHPGDVEIAVDREAARAHSRENLRAYWLGSVVHGIRTALTDRAPEEALEQPDTVVWAVLGAPRLAMVLDPDATHAGPIPSKTEAGHWVIEHHPDFADLATHALAARRGGHVDLTVGDALLTADLVERLASTVS
ncbi:hypothetical protein [Ornithinimicrobium cavernae]|uniref:hypothetical protein n=1 Tax=Ornithinimicrobium cavernae TaxID=2666047 RepID=UPI000D6A0289|nr:hypothetical protein [Ornithinimicrobium cavernae]